jgi:tetratricopeptide (TPR) repeat protein
LAVRVLVLDPSSLGAGLVQAAVARRSGDPQRSIAICERWADSAPASSRHLVLFEKARALEALRNTEAALATFTAANAAQLANTRPPRDPDRAFAQVAALTALHRRGPPTMTPPAGQDPEGPGREGNDLLFVVGFPRSGTTLLDQMLDAHPEIQVIEERPLVAAMIADLAAAGRAYPADLPRLDAELLYRLRRNYQDRMARHLTSAARTYTVDKMPLNLVHVALIRQVFPAARFILALRHPCDVVLSCFMQSFALNDWMAALTSLDRAADLYSAAFGAWESYVASVPTPAITVRYEDVVDDLEREARRITEFLEIPFDLAMLAFHQHARTRGVLSTPSAAQVTQPIYRTALARWRRYDAAMRPIAERLAPEIARYGYAETRP